MITSIMAGFAFGYCIMDLILNLHNRKQMQELLKTTIEIKQ